MSSDLPFRRRSIRLKNFDYSQHGAYFVTMCVHGGLNLFGHFSNGLLTINDAGKMIEHWWNKMAEKFHNVDIDEYIVMPNHFHGIIIINDNVGAIPCNRPIVSCQGENVVSPLQQIPNTYNGLGQYISWFKRMSTNEYIRNVKHGLYRRFDHRLWQRNYYEHIIRNEESLNEIRNYIFHNPQTWKDDDLFVP